MEQLGRKLGVKRRNRTKADITASLAGVSGHKKRADHVVDPVCVVRGGWEVEFGGVESGGSA